MEPPFQFKSHLLKGLNFGKKEHHTLKTQSTGGES